ncbi:MAG: hypothetical protein ABIR84_06715 [Candidatus Nitrotoga sp.]
MGVCFKPSMLPGSDLSVCFGSIFIQLFNGLMQSCGSCDLKFRHFQKQKWRFRLLGWRISDTFFILLDSSRDSWLGFGVKLGRKHAYIIRRKAQGKPITCTRFAQINLFHVYILIFSKN